MLETLLETAFKFELDSGKPIIGSALKLHQIEVLQTIIDKPKLFSFINLYSFTQRRLPQTLQGLARLIEEAEASKADLPI